MGKKTKKLESKIKKLKKKNTKLKDRVAAGEVKIAKMKNKDPEHDKNQRASVKDASLEAEKARERDSKVTQQAKAPKKPEKREGGAPTPPSPDSGQAPAEASEQSTSPRAAKAAKPAGKVAPVGKDEGGAS